MTQLRQRFKSTGEFFMRTHLRQLWQAGLCSVAMAAAPCSATDMVYVPINPSFGGSPLNAAGLLATAQAQNGFKAPVLSPVEQFNKNLQQAILARLQGQILTSMFGSSTTVQPGTFETSGFKVTVTDLGNGTLLVSTYDKNSGGTAQFTVDTSQ